jgi:RNA-directed DNA polymerase
MASAKPALLPALEKRLREELAELQVEMNEDKSRTVDLEQGELRISEI